MLLLWRVAYMYWLPSKQMQVWQETKASEEDPNLLLEKFTIRFDKYKRTNTVVTSAIVLISVY